MPVAMTGRFFFLAFAVTVCLLSFAASAHNITAILDAYPEYSVYNSFLTQTKVCDEINAHETVTCLVLSNPVMTSLASGQPLNSVKNALQLLTLLDYWDPQKLHALSRGTVLSTTLYQTTGLAQGSLGFVNITDLRGGKVGFKSSAPGSDFNSTYTKSVQQVPYNLSVVEISAPILFPGILDSGAAGDNITALLEKAGCKKFAALLVSSGVIKMYESAMGKGLTVLAPNDDAFDKPGVPDLSTLSSAELVTVLQYHALPEYAPKATLKTSKGKLPTLASSASGKYDLAVVSHGDDVSLDSGVDTSRVASTVLDSTPVVLLTVDGLLLPSEIFGRGPSPAPSPSGEAPALAPAVFAPAPAPEGKKPKAPSKSKPKSRHAPTAVSPDLAPADEPAADESAVADREVKKKNNAGAPRCLGAAATATLALTLMTLY